MNREPMLGRNGSRLVRIEFVKGRPSPDITGPRVASPFPHASTASRRPNDQKRQPSSALSARGNNSPGLKGDRNLNYDVPDKPRYPGTRHTETKGVPEKGILVPNIVQANQRLTGTRGGRHFTSRAHQTAVQSGRSGVSLSFLASDLANRSTWCTVPPMYCELLRSRQHRSWLFPIRVKLTIYPPVANQIALPVRGPGHEPRTNAGEERRMGSAIRNRKKKAVTECNQTSCNRPSPVCLQSLTAANRRFKRHFLPR